MLTPVLLTFVGCAHNETRWTPESVAPPAATQAGIQTPKPLPERTSPVVTPAPAPADAPPATEAAPIPLTRDGAILTALFHNLTIDVARLGPEIDATLIDEARAAFDPGLTAAVSTGRNRTQSGRFGSNSLGSTGPTGGAAPNTTTVGQIVNLVQQTQRFNSLLQQIDPASTENDDTLGSVRLDQTLPSGTALFLSGSGQNTDSTLSGSDSEGDIVVGVSQPLLRGAGFAVNLAALRQATNTAAQSEHEFRETVLDVIRQVDDVYWELTLAEELLAIQRFGVELAQAQLMREQDRFSVGKALEGDVMQAQAERALRVADLVDAEASVREQTVELLRLLNPEGAPNWAVTFETVDRPEVVEIARDASASERLALQFRPELAQARLDIANLDLDVLTARNGLLPRLDVVGTVGRANPSGSSGVSNGNTGTYDTYGIGLELQTSILNRAERARHLRARLATTQGERILADLEQFVASEVWQAIIQIERQWQRLEATTEAVESQTETVRVIEGRRDVGRATNLDVLQVQRDLIQAEVEDATARVRYIQALTALYAAEGTLLERRGVVLEQAAQANDESDHAINVLR